ncbi:hypothetical protein AB4068_15560, partial [Arthrobacter sp. 2RAF22]|uniref:hypothetical protein n=1 Tax=Arthrobacter sp. 2RAF22 TaxID=3232996 RepID=UPI003F8F175C
GSTTAMIDTDLLVYAGTLAIFIIAALAVGILCLVVFTALATTASIKKARRNQHTRKEYADVQGPERLDAGPHSEPWGETLVPVFFEERDGLGHGPGGKKGLRVRRPNRPRIIQHI